MFEVKLGTGRTFAASSVEERWSEPTAYSAAYTLSFEMTPAEMETEGYAELFAQEGALDPIEVTLDGEPCGTYTGYTEVNSVSVRLLADGRKSGSVLLAKAK